MSFLRYFSDIGLAFDNLRAQKTRTVLTALGIVFGVGSVIGMLAIGAGAREESLSFIERLGVRNVLVESIASASPINPAETIIKLPADLAWKPNPNNPPRSSESCALTGAPTEPGLYYTLVRWWPGYMSAPHTYTSDRFCMVLSGTWWCNSGNDFDPASCVPAPAGSFVRRVAGTPHYDGVIRSHNEPAIIAICGIGRVNYKLVDPSKPGWRAV